MKCLVLNPEFEGRCAEKSSKTIKQRAQTKSHRETLIGFMQKLFLATAEATAKEMEANGMLLEAKTLKGLSKTEVLKTARPGGVLANVFK